MAAKNFPTCKKNRHDHGALTRWSLLVAALALSACGGSGNESSDAPSKRSDPAPVASTDLEPTLEPAPAPAPVVLPSPTPSVPAPPPSQQLSEGLDLSQPGLAVRPVAATSSTTANPTNTAAKAMDGIAGTRWESASVDDAWLSFDFGTKTPLGYMKLTWENAYGREYAIQGSDDGTTWYQLRQVNNGRGGIEEFFNLNANVRYVRLAGIARGTRYGYSLIDVEFKSPGRDNSLPVLNTAAVPFPANGSGLASPPAEQPPIETLQFTLPDGTLVTRFGMMGRSRHARERGEDWNEVGYGTNETVDASGQPRDRSTGAHLNFVANYFKNRTWGVELIDNTNVPGVTRPRLIVNQYFKQRQRGGGHAFVRRFDAPQVTGFGWMSPGKLLDGTTYLADDAKCQVVPLPPQTALARPSSGYGGIVGANDGCSVVFDTFPGHSSLSANADGVLVPNGTHVPSRALRAGEAIEFTSSFFSTRAAMDALGDSGNFRYYTNELTYVMGVGLRPWYGVQPRLMNAPLPPETLQGGIGSISYDYADNSAFMFQQPHNHIGMQNMQRFVEGRRWIHTHMGTGDHNESGNDRNLAGVGLLGPRFNQATCFGCHINNGRSLAPTALNQRLDTMTVLAAKANAAGQQLPHPMYGLAVQANTRPSGDTRQDWGLGVRVAGFDVRTVTLADGTVVELRKPRLAFEGPTPEIHSLRNAQPMIGMGLLEAIPEADILARARSTPDADGVKGTANFVFDPETGAVHIGRFGWKASKASLRHQAAAAALQDMSVTTPIYPSRDCLAGPSRCASGRAERGLSEQDLQLITHYLALLGVPAQRSQASGFPRGVAPLAPLDVRPADVAAGARVFERAKCVACHTSQMTTGRGSPFAEVRDQTIRPYTNLLLHDMGPDLADNFAEGQASGRMWRTAPLWGIGYTEGVAGGAGRAGYLHDGRARTLTEAVLWHGGEATTSRRLFENLSRADREALLAFLKSL